MHQKIYKTEDFTDEELVTASTETMGGNPSQKSLWAQSELTRRLMESIRGFDKSTSRYSKVMLVLTIVLLIIACMQFVAGVTRPLGTWYEQLAVLLLVFGAVLYFGKKTIDIIEKW